MILWKQTHHKGALELVSWAPEGRRVHRVWPAVWRGLVLGFMVALALAALLHLHHP
jgi:hypothetical protein